MLCSSFRAIPSIGSKASAWLRLRQNCLHLQLAAVMTSSTVVGETMFWMVVPELMPSKVARVTTFSMAEAEKTSWTAVLVATIWTAAKASMPSMAVPALMCWMAARAMTLSMAAKATTASPVVRARTTLNSPMAMTSSSISKTVPM